MKVRKLIPAATVLLLAAAIYPASAPAATAIKSGQNCAKLNAERKITFKKETYVYKCVKNPRYKPTRLTWTLDECLVAIADFNAADAKNKATIAAGGTPTTLDTELLGLARQLRNMSCKAGI